MCHLVSWLEPPAKTSAGLNLPQMKVFPDIEEAKPFAEILLLSGCTEVQVWKRVLNPTVIQSVKWN